MTDLFYGANPWKGRQASVPLCLLGMSSMHSYFYSCFQVGTLCKNKCCTIENTQWYIQIKCKCNVFQHPGVLTVGWASTSFSSSYLLHVMLYTKHPIPAEWWTSEHHVFTLVPHYFSYTPLSKVMTEEVACFCAQEYTNTCMHQAWLTESMSNYSMFNNIMSVTERQEGKQPRHTFSNMFSKVQTKSR